MLIKFFFFGLFRAAPRAYGSFQARGWIETPAASLHHSHSDSGSKSCLWPVPRQCWMLNPLCKARDGTCILMDTNQIHFHWATMGTPFFLFNFDKTWFFYVEKISHVYIVLWLLGGWVWVFLTHSFWVVFPVYLRWLKKWHFKPSVLYLPCKNGWYLFLVCCCFAGT